MTLCACNQVLCSLWFYDMMLATDNSDVIVINSDLKFITGKERSAKVIFSIMGLLNLYQICMQIFTRLKMNPMPTLSIAMNCSHHLY